jgi:hypothetical protein
MTKDEALRLALEALEGADEIDCDMRDAIIAIKAALEAKDTLKWKLRGHTTLDTLQNEKIAESFGWGKGESYDDCICCSAFNLHDFAEAIRFDERERLVGKTQEPEPDKSSLFSYKTLIAYAASCVAEALSDIRQQSQLEEKDEPVLWRNAAIRLGEELSSVGPNGYYDMSAKEWLDWAMEQNPRGKYSLPQRKPLSDEEIKALDYSGTRIEFVRAIEAAHGIKGEA